MKTYLKSVLAIIAILLCACEKDPTFAIRSINDNATKVSNITTTSAEVIVSIFETESGDYYNPKQNKLRVYYSTSPDPFQGMYKEEYNYIFSAGTYTFRLSYLEPGTTYYYAAKLGDQKGEVRSFKTKGIASISVTTGSVTNITTSSATLYGSCTLINDAVLQESGILLHTTSSVSYSNYTKRYYGTSTEFKAEAKDLTSNATYYYCAYAIDDKGNKYYGEVKSFKTEKQPPRSAKTVVDLGLSVKWAAGNVGATKESDYGDYFAWGETSPKSVYDWSTYFDTKDGGSTFMKYPNDGTTLDLSDDAAHVNWGGNWRIPTYNELYELETKCTWIWTSDYNGTGVKGYIASSKTNGNSIFLPASGCRFDSSLNGVGSYGYYWSSSLFSESGSYKSAYLNIYSSDVFCYIGNRSLGYSVRPVCQ